MPTRPTAYRPASTARPKPGRRPSACARGYDRRWQKLRLSHLAEHPLCVPCLSAGRTTEATEVDHRIPHKGDHSLLFDADNLTSMCKACHGRKTATEDGGFGHPVRPKPQSH